MADPRDPFSQNILGVQSLIEEETNKVNSTSTGGGEGVNGEKGDALSLKMDDKELLALRDEWEKEYAPYETKIKQVFTKNLESYLGKKPNGQWLAGDETIAANLQFEAEETFLASAMAKEPSPVVFADNTVEGNKIASDVRTMLRFHSQILALRTKLKIMARQWSIYHLGVLKFGWDDATNDVDFDNRKIQDFIFDPKGYVNAYGDFVGYLGERIKVSAEKLALLFPSHSQYIKEKVEGKMGTEVKYTEWWTDEYTFTTFGERILDKSKNPFYLYSEEEKDELGGVVVDEVGMPVYFEPRNHFPVPKKPYIFLSVFSLQEQPHDITGLVEQNIPNQNLIRKRTEQIDFNISAANNSFALSADNFNEETAKQAANARRRGNPILIPSGGPIDKSMLPLNAQDLPPATFAQLQTSKNDLRTSWGVQGITAEPEDEDQTARGMILNQSHDTTRIGGGIGSSIEQVASGVFNWLVQFYYVFYDEPHFGAILGSSKSVDFVKLSNAQMDRQLVVSVSPDSMRPKDEITELNLAQALYDKGAIGPKTLLKMVDFPNPEESAADGVLWTVDKASYLRLNFPQLFNELTQAVAPVVPTGGGVAPEETTEPPVDIAREATSPALSQVPLPQ